MKRAEFLAWVGLAGLIVIAGILLAGGLMYGMAAFWAGMMVASGQAVVVGLAGWGLMLARQRAEMVELPVEKTASGFRMMFGEHAGERISGEAGVSVGASETEVKTLDTGFQRLVTTIAAAVLIGLAGVISWFVIYGNVAWARANPDKPFPIAGAFDKPVVVDELGLVIGLGAAAVYVILYVLTRVKRETAGYGEAVNSNFAMGVGGMAALGVASVLAYLRVSYASEVAAGIMAALLLLQGLELLVNAMRSYSGIEEFDQEAVDLQAVPLVPMLSSVWLNALKILGAQSLGLGGGKELGVIGRMMPRALLALVVIGIAVSCLRVVQPGEVAVLERLGATQMTADGKQVALLQPGLHVLLPWPMDELLRIPTQELQEADVGAELHSAPGQKTVDFEFWMVRGGEDNPATAMESQFATGDPGSPQLLETYVKILWRVADPGKYYNGLSHGDFYEKGNGETLAVRTPYALVQQCAAFAVTRTFAIHSLDQIMLTDRTEVQQHCKRILQDKLDAASSGIEVTDLTIADLHPPYAFKDQPDYTSPDQVKRGPASAYENVVSMREYKETVLDFGMTAQIVSINQAKGEAAASVSQAQGYQYSTVAKAEGEAARMTAMTEGREGMTVDEGSLFDRLARTQTLYNSLKDALAPIQKVVVDPKVKDVQLYQTTNNGPAQLRPPGS